jgi:hypothetical protein
MSSGRGIVGSAFCRRQRNIAEQPPHLWRSCAEVSSASDAGSISRFIISPGPFVKGSGVWFLGNRVRVPASRGPRGICRAGRLGSAFLVRSYLPYGWINVQWRAVARLGSKPPSQAAPARPLDPRAHQVQWYSRGKLDKSRRVYTVNETQCSVTDAYACVASAPPRPASGLPRVP